MEAFNAFALEPLSSGDIIDRAVRLYRRHFLVLLRIVAGPSLVAYAGGIMYTIGVRNFSLERGDARMLMMLLLVLAGMTLYIVGKIAFFAVLGGTARSLAAYFAAGEPIRARDVFRAVRSRFWQLLGATMVVVVLLMSVASFLYGMVVFGIILYVLLTGLVLAGAPWWFLGVMHVTTGVASAAGLLVLFLFIYSRIVFIPQALMVEGKGVIASVMRSFELAGRDLRKIAAIFAFQMYMAWSLLLLLIIPLGWYGYINGVDVNPLGGAAPLWYNIAQQTLGQASEILLAPIAMLSFTLLYLDVRVRREGLDVEILADRRLPPPPPIVWTPRVVQPSFVPPMPAAGGFDGSGLIRLNLHTDDTTPPAQPHPEAIPASTSDSESIPGREDDQE
ncbi:MAG: hypothetical protein KF868_08380 [Acidobacteria bacterium]|nr:hypothetical protein [Acidobacteriota bacterium]MCW5971289.1 hypothetical protein [Blastocatellales bacterium]